MVWMALFWSALTLGFDAMSGWGSFRQLRALSYSTTAGRITSATVETISGSGGRHGSGTTYRPRLTYTYSVAGKDYQGDRYRYSEWSGSGRNAHGIVAAHPVGSHVSVYYAPADPADAVLMAGLEGFDYFVPLFMLPFNLIMLFFWIQVGGGIYRRRFFTPVSGVKVWDDGFSFRARLTMRPLYVGAIVVGALAVPAIFIVAFGFSFNPPVPVMRVVWRVILGGGLLAWLYHLLNVLRGGYDLVIDGVGATVTLPRTFGRKESLVVPAGQIHGVEIDRLQVGQASAYIPTLVFTDGEGPLRREKLAKWSSKGRARELAAWLRERLGIAPAKSLSE
jgi:hypothetical protein